MIVSFLDSAHLKETHVIFYRFLPQQRSSLVPFHFQGISL